MDSDQKFELICFCCLTEVGQMKDMLHEVFTFTEKKVKIQFVESYTICTGIDESQIDGSSAYICLNCECKMKASYEFRELCRTSFRTIKDKTSIAADLLEIKHEVGSDGEEMYFVYNESGKESSNTLSQVYIKENDPMSSTGPRTSKLKTEAIEEDLDFGCKSTVQVKKRRKCDVSGANVSNLTAKFMCYYCDTFQDSHEKYVEHRQNEHADGLWQLNRTCNICGEDVKGYNKHIADVHKDYKPNTCNMCPLKYQTQHDLKLHLATHSDLPVPFECLDCKEKFKSSVTLRQHVLRKSTPDIYHCPYCGLGFINIFKLQQHFQVGHDTSKKLYPCFRCKKIYLRKHEYKLHECTHKKSYIPKLELAASKCDRCKQDFFNAEEFSCHQFLECEDDNNQCVTCGKKFESLRKLVCHKKNHEPMEKLFVCDICGDAFVNATRLQSHRSRHSSRRPFKCRVCLAAFRLKFMLISHMKMHEEKRFECEICWKKFRHYIGIRSHMTSHLENRADYVNKDATCDLCGKVMTKNTLGKHLKTHSDERDVLCPICGKGFQHVSHRNRHYRKIHEGLFYECKYCGKSIKEKEKFRAHLFIHRGFKPFHCPACTSEFVPKYLFVKHLRVRHNIEFNESEHGYREKENINAIIEECLRIPFKIDETGQVSESSAVATQ